MVLGKKKIFYFFKDNYKCSVRSVKSQISRYLVFKLHESSLLKDSALAGCGLALWVPLLVFSLFLQLSVCKSSETLSDGELTMPESSV